MSHAAQSDSISLPLVALAPEALARRIAVVFPGQGAQQVGMGKAFFEALVPAQQTFSVFDQYCSDSQTGVSLSQICFEGPEDTLKRTLFTQPAILATAIAAYDAFLARCPIQPVVAAGHSLGEYGALYAAGVLSIESAAQLIQKRAGLMEQAKQGAMSAIVGLSAEQIQSILDTVLSEQPTQDGALVIANYNAKEQSVISGTPALVELAGTRLKEAGAKMVVSLPVGGAFHSPLMTPAAGEFAAILARMSFQAARFPVVSNVDAIARTEGPELQRKLSEQMDHSVRWTQTMETILALNVDTVIEFGPGKVLTGLFKKMAPQLTLLNVSDLNSLDKAVSHFLPVAAQPEVLVEQV